MCRGAKRFWRWFVNWWRAPSLLDQFLSLPHEPEILELTEDMQYGIDPFGRFKRKMDALKR